MSIKRYLCSKDTTITNAFKSNLTTRATGSNAGDADVLQVFSIYAQASTSSLSSSELARMLLDFPVATITSDRSANKIPASGSVNFYLKMFNSPHVETTPKGFTLNVAPVSRSWEEGFGLDLAEYSDLTKDDTGANWINAGSAALWTSAGGDYLSSPTSSQVFPEGTEDLEVDVTPLIEQWIAGTTPSNGIGVFLTSSQETANRSYYLKQFYSRTSEYFFSRPIIEARWNSATTDDRSKFFVSSSLLSSADNTHTIYLYNYVKGQLKNIAEVGTGSIYVQVYNSASSGDLITTTPSVVTGGWHATGIYSASFAMDTTSSTAYDRWFNAAGSVYYYTGSITPIPFNASNSFIETFKYVGNITNLKPSYDAEETARLRFFTRLRDQQQNIYSIASNDPKIDIIDNVFWKVYRVKDNFEIIPYGTGSDNHTKLSYDSSGSFFDFDFSILEKGYAYAFKFVYQLDTNFYSEFDETFKFRVEDE